MTKFSDSLYTSLETYALDHASKHLAFKEDNVDVLPGPGEVSIDKTIASLSKAIEEAEFSPDFKFGKLLDNVKILQVQKHKDFEKLASLILKKQNESTFPDAKELKELSALSEGKRKEKLINLASKFPEQMYQNLDQLNFSDKQERAAVLDRCLSRINTENYYNIASNLDQSRQEDFFAFAKIVAKKDSKPTESICGLFIIFKVDFSLQDDLLALAKIVAEKDPKLFVYHIKNFKIDSSRQEDLLCLAKIVAEKLAEKEAVALIHYIQDFNIESSRQEDLLALAKILAKKDPERFARNIEKFKIDFSRQEDLLALAKILTEKDPDFLLNFVINLKIDRSRQDDLFALARILAEKDPCLLADSLTLFQLDSSRDSDLYSLAKICTQNGFLGFFLNFQRTSSREKELMTLVRKLDPNFVIIDSLPKVRGFVTYEEFLSRIRERDPALFMDVISGADLPQDLKEFQGLLETHKLDLKSLLSFEYRMNPDLPMKKEVVELFLRYKDTPDFIKLRLALQTHPDFEEIARMAKEGIIPESKLTPKETFFKLGIEEQRSQMLRAQILREREALPIANRILKKASEGKPVNNELIEQALKLYKKVGAEGSGRVHDRLISLIQDPRQETKIKALAIQALSEVENDPQNAQRKAFLLNELQKTEDLTLQIVLLDALGRYNFSQKEDLSSIKTSIVKLSSKDPLDTNLKKSLVYLATTIPDEAAIKIAYQLVNQKPWDSSNYNRNIAISGGFNLFPYRPTAHDSQKQLNFVIGQRLVELKRSQMEKRAQEILVGFRANLDSHASLAQLESNIKGFKSGIRYYPTPLFMPAGTVSFRGINARQGERLAEAAFLDFWVKGSGSSDLSLFDDFCDGTWSKVGQMFSSTTLDYVMNGYFDESGMLMTVPGEALNEQILRRNIRLQREGSIHFVSYTRLAHHQISRLFISNVSQPRIEALATAPLKATDKALKTPTMEKIARRNLERVVSQPRPLKDRVTYFDPKNNLATEIREKMTSLGLREATTQEIIDENLKRHIMLGLLREHLTDPDLITAFAEPPKVEPLQVIDR